MKLDPQQFNVKQFNALDAFAKNNTPDTPISEDILAILNEDNPEADAQAEAILSGKTAGAIPAQDQIEQSEYEDQPAVSVSENITLPTVGGLVGELADYINRTAMCPQPLLSLGASLVFCGSMFAKWFETTDNSGNTSNLFAMGVGDSSCGKDWAKRVILSILQHFHALSFSCGEVSSDTALERKVRNAPGNNMLVMIDEAGGFLENISGGNKNSPAGSSSVSEALKRMYSAAGNVYLPKAKASEGGEPIENPNISFYGMTTPRRFYDGIHPEELEGGFTARCLVFITDTAPEPQPKPREEIPERILSIVGKFLPRIKQDGMPLLLPQSPTLVDFDNDAKEFFKERAHYNHTIKEKLREDHDKCAPLYGKVIENAKKVALILACGNAAWNGEAIPHITFNDAETACNIVFELTRNLHKQIANNVAENPYERNLQRIEAFINSTGTRGVSNRDIGRRFTNLDEDYRKGILAHLENAGKITMKERRGRGRTAMVWMHENFCHNDQ